MSFNSTSKVLPCLTSTEAFGVILPHTDKILSESEIDSRIQKAKGHIEHLSNAQSHRTTHGGKKIRGRQISLRNQIDESKERLDLLKSAKELIVKLSNPGRDKLNSKAIARFHIEQLGLSEVDGMLMHEGTPATLKQITKLMIITLGNREETAGLAQFMYDINLSLVNTKQRAKEQEAVRLKNPVIKINSDPSTPDRNSIKSALKQMMDFDRYVEMSKENGFTIESEVVITPDNRVYPYSSFENEWTEMHQCLINKLEQWGYKYNKETNNFSDCCCDYVTFTVAEACNSYAMLIERKIIPIDFSKGEPLFTVIARAVMQ